MNDESVRKNFLAIQQFMKETRNQLDAIQTDVNSLHSVVAMNQQQLRDLQQKIGLLQAMRGSGPTSAD
jgi:4-diphosphocytidyl-2C-methyl-D-erythritol kinase